MQRLLCERETIQQMLMVMWIRIQKFVFIVNRALRNLSITLNHEVVPLAYVKKILA